MNNIKEKFNNLRNSMPKGSMWLLLAAAFVVVIILLTLLLTNKKTKDDVPAQTLNQPIMVTIAPNSIDFSDTDIDSPKPNATVVLSTNASIKVENIELSDIPGLTVSDNCTIRSEITAKMKCKITFEYKPTSEYQNTNIVANVVWYAVTDRQDMIQKTPIEIKIGAKETKTMEPIVVSEPDVIYTPEPIKQEVIRAVEDIAPVVSKFEPEPVKQVSEACSDFALPGYDTSGTQIGWIKPESGTYYFHPFSDKDCNDPTGIYNPDNGIITDIDNRGKKIGTDAEHIGYSIVGNGTLPQLQKRQSTTLATTNQNRVFGEMGHVAKENPINQEKYLGSAAKTGESVISSRPYDRTFILRQFKPIPATIVSEIRADPSMYNCIAPGDNGTECIGGGIPVRATVDRNVYSDNGRTIILPTGTLLLGYLTGELPGPYKAIGRMKINWYQFIRPDGVEFNFSEGQDPYSADAQGRVGVPGHGSTDYVEQIVMPLLTAMVPAAVNLIAPIADTFVNQIDLDNNTVVQSGTVRSSELAKNEVITAWNQVAQKLLVDALNNTTPPFSIAAGTRITVYSPVDLIVTCGDNEGSNCKIAEYSENPRRTWASVKGGEGKDPLRVNYASDGWIGQVRSFNIPDEWCMKNENGAWTANSSMIPAMQQKGYDYRTVLAYCQASNYKAINNAKQEALYQNQVSTGSSVYNYDTSNQDYNTNVLGLTYDGDKIVNPFNAPATSTDTPSVITCEDGKLPDVNGCCTGEVYTDMGEQGFNCCPTSGGDCFPPIL